MALSRGAKSNAQMEQSCLALVLSLNAKITTDPKWVLGMPMLQGFPSAMCACASCPQD